MTQIICIGSLAKDVFFPTKEGRIIENSDDAKEKQLISFEFGAKYQIEDRFEALGGCAANASLGLAKLGLKVSALGRVGQDDLGKEIIDFLKKDNVGTEQIAAEAAVEGQKAQINHLQGAIKAFHRKVTKQNEKIKAKDEQISGLDRANDELSFKNMELESTVSRQERQLKAQAEDLGAVNDHLLVVTNKLFEAQKVLLSLNGRPESKVKKTELFKVIKEIEQALSAAEPVEIEVTGASDSTNDLPTAESILPKPEEV